MPELELKLGETDKIKGIINRIKPEVYSLSPNGQKAFIIQLFRDFKELVKKVMDK